MKKEIILSIIIILLISVTAVGLYFLLQSTEYVYDFEEGFNNWQSDAFDEVQEDLFVDWNVSRTTDRAYSGNYSIRLDFDGRHDDGGVWIEKLFSLDKSYTGKIKVSFYMYNEVESFNKIANTFILISKNNPQFNLSYDTGDYDKIFSTSACDFAGWKELSYKARVQRTEQIWVAIGIMASWETLMSFEIDYITIKM